MAKKKHWSDLQTYIGDYAANVALCRQGGKVDLVQDRRLVTCKKCIKIATDKGFIGVGKNNG